MFTLLFILIIVCVVCGMKKKKHNSSSDEQARREFPNFTIHASEMSTFSKIWNLALVKSELLKYISFKNGWVTIRMENGKEINGALSELHVDFEKTQGMIYYTIKSPGGKVKFYRTTNISDKEWDVINCLLCLAGSTRGEEIFSSAYKRIGYVNSALKVLKFIQ